jgi:hypothetical protein
MLLRVALVASAFSAFILAEEPPAAPVFSGQIFPDQEKSLTQLTQQALDKQVRAVVTGKQSNEAPNPTRMPYHRFVLPSQRVKPLGGLWQIAQAFPSLGPVTINKAPAFCAVPLLEANESASIDPMAKPTGKTDFDQIGKASPVPVCKNWQ